MSKEVNKPTTPFNVAPIKTSYAAPMQAIAKPVYVPRVYEHAHLPVLTDANVPPTLLMQTLYRALRSRRAGDSMAEAKFVAWLVNRLAVTMIDAAGNIHVDTRTQPQHTTMFTSHTDTVHHVGGPNEIRFDDTNPKAIKWRAGEGACLGADDGAGIALMVHMLDCKVPGYYVFFRGEESGGTGSRWLANNMPHALKGIDRCISFDRADYADVITHQGCGRCCSDEFAMALAQQLTTDDFELAYLPDDTGVFTDSANLIDIVPECTNLSVGYKSQHGDSEWQDVTFLQRLATQLPLIDWDGLPTKRDPTQPDPDRFKDYSFGSMHGTASTHSAAVDRSFSTTSRGYALEEDEQNCVDALHEAMHGFTHLIREMVANWLMPDSPETVINMLEPMRIHISDYSDYALGIANGSYDMAEVLDILGEDMQ